MNYQRIYTQIVQRAKEEKRIKSKDGIYFERHHIVPKCLGGNNSKDNLVLLTAREHFLCHWILIRIYTDNYKLSSAFWAMCNKKSKRFTHHIPSSRMYSEAKESHSIQLSKKRKGTKQTNETKLKISIAGSKRTHSEETKQKIRDKRKLQIFSQETKDKISKSNIGKRRVLSEEHKKNISLGQIGKIVSEETKQKQRVSQLGKVHSIKSIQKQFATRALNKLNRKCQKH